MRLPVIPTLLSISLISLVISTGCKAGLTKRIQAASSGVVGCAPADITVEDANRQVMAGILTWTALCDDRTFYCSAINQYEIRCEPSTE